VRRTIFFMAAAIAVAIALLVSPDTAAASPNPALSELRADAEAVVRTMVVQAAAYLGALVACASVAVAACAGVSRGLRRLRARLRRAPEPTEARA
jgi:hypothetical protein